MMKNFVFILLALLFAVSSCKKEGRVIYEVQQQELYQNASEKKNLKTTAQFIAIAYSDLFNASITNTELNKLDIAYQAFGDKHVLEDMIIKNFLARGSSTIPTDIVMRADVNVFVEEAYLRFFNRKPNEFESWKMKDLVEKNSDITPQMVFYSLMTSDEYRYY